MVEKQIKIKKKKRKKEVGAVSKRPFQAAGNFCTPWAALR